MKIFYKNSYKVIDGYTLCKYCPFKYKICGVSSHWFNCNKNKLLLEKTQIFNL